MNILFYTPFNSRSRDTESVMEAFVQKGHKVFLLTQAPEGSYHEACKRLGVQVHATPPKKKHFLLRNLSYLFSLVAFCKRHRIHILYAHLETAGIVAVFAQAFMRTKVVVCRHIVDEAYLFNNRNFIIGNKITYALARYVTVVSRRSKEFMVNVEKVNGDKIRIINLAYNFRLYQSPDTATAQQLRKKYSCDLLGLTICRMVEPKRPMLAIKIVEQLLSDGFNIKLVLLGKGPLEDQLKAYVRDHDLGENIFLEGHVPNVLDYLAASDVLIHPSILDSSSVAVKEAGLVRKAVLACKEVGDLDEYLANGADALLVNKDRAEEEMIRRLKSIMNHEIDIKSLGENLHSKVTERFSIEHVIGEYDELHHWIFGKEITHLK